MIPQFIYGGTTGVATAADLERQRMLVEALMGRQRAPQNLGEGLSALGEAIGYRRARARLEKDEGAANEAGNVLFNSLFGGQKDLASTEPASYTSDPVEPPLAEPSFAESFLPKIAPQPETQVASLAPESGIDPTQAQPVPEPMPQQVAQAAPQQPSGQDTAALIQKYEMVLSDPNFQHVDPQRQKIAMARYQQLLEMQAKANEPLQPTAEMRNYEYGLKNPDFAKSGAGSGEMGLVPTYWKDKDGNLHAAQLSKGGGMGELKLPPGASWAPGIQALDIGTGFVPVDKRTGLPANVPVIEKDVAGEAALKIEGKETGEAAALYHSLSSKMPGLQKVVADLEVLADQATYTKTGQLWDVIRKETGQEPRESAVARAKYIAMVDNQVLPMLRDTFGAQFTVVEGESLRATLGDPNRPPAEKKAVLSAFIEQKVRNIEAAAQQGKVPLPSAGTGVKPADWTDEEWNELTPEEKASFGK